MVVAGGIAGLRDGARTALIGTAEKGYVTVEVSAQVRGNRPSPALWVKVQWAHVNEAALVTAASAAAGDRWPRLAAARRHCHRVSR
jgi:hypothetical protein